MPETPIGRVGRIAQSLDPSEVGSFVEIVDDTGGSTGGAYVCTWSADGGGDGWVESLEDVDHYVAESGWIIEWYDDVPPEAQDRRPHHA